MVILLNGQSVSFDTGTLSVRGMLQARGWSFPLIVVKVNDRIIPRPDWESTMIADGDTVQATHLMSGG